MCGAVALYDIKRQKIAFRALDTEIPKKWGSRSSVGTIVLETSALGDVQLSRKKEK